MSAAGVLAGLFAVTHAWNGEFAVLRAHDVEMLPVNTLTVFTYVWHIITVENLAFGIAFVVMSLYPDSSKARFAAWLIAAILVLRLAVIVGTTALLDSSGLAATLVDSIAIILYVILILLGAKFQSRKRRTSPPGDTDAAVSNPTL